MDDFDLSNSCKSRWKVLQEFVRNRKKIRTVILVSYFSHYLNEKPLPGEDSKDYFKLSAELAVNQPGKDVAEGSYKGLSKTIEFFHGTGVQIGIVLDTPAFPYPSVTCLPSRIPFLEGYKNDCLVPRTFNDERQSAERQLVRKITEKYKNVKVFDPLPFMCDEEFCNAKNWQ